MFKCFIWLLLWMSVTAIYGQVNTIARAEVHSPPPPPPSAAIDTTIFKIVPIEYMPRFPGCENLVTLEEKIKCSDQKLLEFFQNYIVYPAEAKEKKVTGTVIISWVIERDGQISSPAIVKDIGSGCGEEALRVVRLLNEKKMKWTPTPARARPVRILMNFPVNFTEEMRNRP